jgi:hypothetical protein
VINVVDWRPGWKGGSPTGGRAGRKRVALFDQSVKAETVAGRVEVADNQVERAAGVLGFPASLGDSAQEGQPRDERIALAIDDENSQFSVRKRHRDAHAFAVVGQSNGLLQTDWVS